MKQYIVICQSIVGNPDDGYRTIYDSDLQRFDTWEQAQDHGFTLDRSDDFNIGTVKGHELLELKWMNEPLSDWPLQPIAEEIGL